MEVCDEVAKTIHLIILTLVKTEIKADLKVY